MLAMLSLLARAACSPALLLETIRVLRGLETGAGEAVSRCAVSYGDGAAIRKGDLYRTEGGAAAGLVLAPGASRQGKDDPRLVSFAEALARGGFEVLVPDLPGLRSLRVEAADAVLIADALAAMSRHRAADGNATLGLAAICYSVGPALLALLEEQARDAAHFMLSIGGYHEMNALIRFWSTGQYDTPADGAVAWREPDSYGKWVLTISNACFLGDPDDRRQLEEMANRRLEDPDADIDALVAALKDEGRPVYDLVANTDPAQVEMLIGRLPPPVRAQIKGLDPSRKDFTGLDMNFVLVHGHDDRVIPETESMKLAAALPNAALYILESMQHVDPGEARLSDKIRMLLAMQAVLRERDVRRAPETAVESPLRFE